jgi:hypothetical protein
MKVSVKWCLYFILALVVGANFFWLIWRRQHAFPGSATGAMGSASEAYGVDSKVAMARKSKTSRASMLKRQFEESFRDRIEIRPHGLPMMGNGEYIMGSLLEREFGSPQIYVSTFLLSRFALRKGRGAELVEPSSRKQWEALLMDNDEDRYHNSGIRKAAKDYFCRISHSSKSEPYYAKALFIPNRLAYDANENKLIEIVRCRLANPLNAFREFSGTHESVYVELFHSTVLIANFSIPWSSRKAGFMLDQYPGSSTVDSWRGYDTLPNDSANHVNSTTADVAVHPVVAHLCVPGLYRVPQGKALHVYIEHITHHLLMGFQHIEISVAFGWDSQAMQLFLLSFKSFIEEGRLSIVSMTTDNIDFTTEFSGLSWSRMSSKVFHATMCLYSAKGVADYVSVLDIDEYLIIKEPSLSSIADLILSVDVHPLRRLEIDSTVPLSQQVTTWRGGVGWADGDAHPLCFMQLYSEVLVDRQLDIGGNVLENPANVTLHSSTGQGDFVGRRYVEGTIGPGLKAHNRFGYVRTIMPTRRIYQSSLISGGACMLANWPCNDDSARLQGRHSSGNRSSICGDVNQPLQPLGQTSSGAIVDFRDYHSFYEVVRSRDGKAINATTQAVIYHFKIFGNAGTNFEGSQKTGMSNATYPKYSDNLYTLKYFPSVVEEVARRGLLDVMAASADITINCSRVVNQKIAGWEKFHKSILLSGTGLQVTNRTNRIVPDVAAPSLLLDSPISREKLAVREAGPLEFQMNASEPSPRINVAASTVQANIISELPNFAADFSEFVLSAMIERKSQSYDLFLTMFMLGHSILDPVGKEDYTSEGALKVSATHAASWKRTINNFAQSAKTLYTPSGDRNSSQHKYFCKLNYNASDPNDVYVVRGYFVPNRLSTDINANRRLDIFRCKMGSDEVKSRELYRLYGTSATTVNLKVDMIRDDSLLMTILVPWASRATGYLMGPTASTLDPWRGSSVTTTEAFTEDVIYLTVPGVESSMSRRSLALYLEFLQHHISLGVSHIFLTAAFAWDEYPATKSTDTFSDSNMHNFIRYLDSYIADSFVSVVSVCDDHLDFAYSTKGLLWGRDNVKIFHVNMYTYFSKGMSEFVGVWDVDEFFIPRLESVMGAGIPDVIRHASYTYPRSMNSSAYINYVPAGLNHRLSEGNIQNSSRSWRSRPGFADGDGHPYCYLVLSSEVTANVVGVQRPLDQPDNPFMGQLFGHGPESRSTLKFLKSIRPTRSVFYGGLHVAGACNLGFPWNGCGADGDTLETSKDAEYAGLACGKGGFKPPRPPGFHVDHFFDEMVTSADAKKIDPRTEATISHMQVYRHWIGASLEALNTTGEYASKYFHGVIQELDRRNLYLPIVLPSLSEIEPGDSYLDDRLYRLPLSDLKFTNLSGPTVSTEMVTLSALPCWSADYSEIILGSVLERSAATHAENAVTIFLLSKEMIRAKVNDETTNNQTDYLHSWQLAKQALELNSVDKSGTGERSSSNVTKEDVQYFCNIALVERPPTTMAEEQALRKVSLPAELLSSFGATEDVLSDGAVDILRCQFQLAADPNFAAQVQIFLQSAEINKTQNGIFVELTRKTIKDDKPLVLVRYFVNVISRINCEFVVPSSGDDFSDTIIHNNADGTRRDDIYLLGGDLETFPNRQSLPVTLEFIEHHLLMGFQRVFVASPFDWRSKHTRRYQRILKSYIRNNQVVLSTLSLPHCDARTGYSGAEDHADKIAMDLGGYCMLGRRWAKPLLQTTLLNIWGYWIKGMVDYVGIWSTHDFFVPKVKASVQTPRPNYIQTTMSTLHNAKGHQENSNFCFAHMFARTVSASRHVPTAEEGDNPLTHVSVDWIQNKYNNHHHYMPTLSLHGQSNLRGQSAPSQNGLPYNLLKKQIRRDISVQRAFIPIANVSSVGYFGMHVPGACNYAANFSAARANDDMMVSVPTTSAVIYHFDPAVTVIPSQSNGSSFSMSSKSANNQYVQHFAEDTVRSLRRKNLDLLVLLPYRRLTQNLLSDDWSNYLDVFYQARNESAAGAE